MTYDNDQPTSPITLDHFDLHFDGPYLYTVEPSDTVEWAEEKVDGHNIDQVPVLDPKSNPRVLTRRMVSRMRAADRTSVRVDEVPDINETPRMLPASTPLTDAVSVLIENDWVLTTDNNGVV